MDDTTERNLVGLKEAELDEYVYRIYAFDRFKSLVAGKEDAVVNPTKWDDPFENFFLERTEVMDPATGSKIPLKNLAADWYGQCWSTNEETDAMWRIYSPDPLTKPGVKVRTTIRKIFSNIKSSGSQAPYLQFFIGKVRYLSENDITKLMSHLTFMDIAIGGQGDHFAELLCLKRTAFQHESEIRLLFQDIDLPSKRGIGGVYKYSLDPNTLFDEAVLDPRLSDLDANKLQSDLVSAGCSLSIRRSDLYQVPGFVIPAS